MYTVEKIHERQLQKVDEIKDLLGINPDKAILILRYFKWDTDKLQNNWFDKEKQLKLQIGIEFDQSIPKRFAYVNASLHANNQGCCNICYSYFNAKT